MVLRRGKWGCRGWKIKSVSWGIDKECGRWGKRKRGRVETGKTKRHKKTNRRLSKKTHTHLKGIVSWYKLIFSNGMYQSITWANLIVMSSWLADQHLHLAVPTLVRFCHTHTIHLASRLIDPTDLGLWWQISKGYTSERELRPRHWCTHHELWGSTSVPANWY